MKRNIKYLIGMGALAGMIITGCKNEFFNRPPGNEPIASNYYQTVAQVQANTDILYASPWFGFNGKAFLATSELLSGNARCYVGADSEFGAYSNYTEGNSTPAVTSTWNSLYTVVAQANAILNNLPLATPSTVLPVAAINNGLGEAHLMRAAAYFYLVRIFGNVPIVTDPLALVNSSSSVPTNYVTDVYTFIENDLKFAEANCTPGVASTGHGSSGSASGLLAKVYLYEQKYALAKTEAEKVINSGEFGIMGIDFGGTYTSLFEIPANNNKESMIAMQWASNAGYGFGNQLQSVLALNSTITGTGDGYAQLGPTYDLQNAYIAEGDTIRRHGTIMIPGDFYPEIDKATGGYVVPLNADAQGTSAGIKKYVVGTPADNSGLTAFQATSENTYILRYADIYLIEAEAIMGIATGVAPGTGIDTNATSSDPTALKYINLIRQRASVPALTSFTYRQLLKERRLEFAIEGDYWYDLQRIDGFNSSTHPVAEAIESTINKGDSYGSSPPYTINHIYIVPTDAQFIMPIPATEVAADPALSKPPVHYNFNSKLK